MKDAVLRVISLCKLKPICVSNHMWQLFRIVRVHDDCYFVVMFGAFEFVAQVAETVVVMYGNGR